MSHGPARSLSLMLSEPPVLNELCARESLEGGACSDLPWLHRPTCVDSAQRSLNPELEKKKENSTVLNSHSFVMFCLHFSVLYLLMTPESPELLVL